MTTCAIGAALLVIPLGNIYYTCIFATFLAFFIVPILPSTYPYTVLISQPIAPSIVNGLMMTGAQLMAVINTIVVTLLLRRS